MVVGTPGMSKSVHYFRFYSLKKGGGKNFWDTVNRAVKKSRAQSSTIGLIRVSDCHLWEGALVFIIELKMCKCLT